jgi:hypothetical protein
MFSPASNHILEANEQDESSAISRYFSINFLMLYNIIFFFLASPGRGLKHENALAFPPLG